MEDFIAIELFLARHSLFLGNPLYSFWNEQSRTDGATYNRAILKGQRARGQMPLTPADPRSTFGGHTEEARHIRDQNLRGTIKELAQLDGAFVVSDQGIVVSACRYLDAIASDVALPCGLASRYLAGA